MEEGESHKRCYNSLLVQYEGVIEERDVARAELAVSQNTSAELRKEINRARAGKEPTSNALAVCNAELATSLSHYATLGDELYEANETIAQLRNLTEPPKLKALLDDGHVFKLLRRSAPDCDDGRGAYGVASLKRGGYPVEFYGPTIIEALSSLVESLTAAADAAKDKSCT